MDFQGQEEAQRPPRRRQLFVCASDHSFRIFPDLKQMPVARSQNTQAKPRKRMIIMLMRAGNRYLDFEISILRNSGMT
jgi:hypothetical protein